MIGRTNAGGGGGMGLTVVGGLSRPANASHNTIWVETDTKIAGYALSATEPEAAEGMLWIVIADSGVTKVCTPVGLEWITIYLSSAKQYINGAWVEKNAMLYQDGTWKEWVITLFLNGYNGDMWSNSIADFTADGWNRDGASAPDGSTVSIGETMTLSVNIGSNSNYQDAVAVGTRNLVDLTNCNKIKAVCYLASKSGNTNGVAKLSINPTLITPFRTESLAASVEIPEGSSIVELDVSNIFGMFHVLIGGISGTVGYDLTISSVTLE